MHRLWRAFVVRHWCTIKQIWRSRPGRVQAMYPPRQTRRHSWLEVVGFCSLALLQMFALTNLRYLSKDRNKFMDLYVPIGAVVMLVVLQFADPTLNRAVTL